MELPGTHLNGGPALIVSTRKGVFFLQPHPGEAHQSTPIDAELANTADLHDTSRCAEARSWQLSDPLFLGHIVNHTVLDPRDGRTMIAAVRTGHLGPTIFRSTDAGRSWREALRPPAFAKAGPGETPRVVGHTFWLTSGHPGEPGVWFAGTSPQALWTSEDDGNTWRSVTGFNDHPDYNMRCVDPQAGTPDGDVMHSIIIDPRDARHMYLGLSGGGVYETTDRGHTWQPLNSGVSTPQTEIGTDGMELAPGSIAWKAEGPQHDPHCVQLHPANPDVLYQQNHCGIYRLQRPENTWERIGRNMPPDVGDIGFVIGLHPVRTDTAWVFPMDGTDVWPRTSPDGRPATYVTRNSGANWQRQDTGLPTRGWFTVKRQSMSVDCTSVNNHGTACITFGTTSGEIWRSDDEGEHWHCVAQHLPEIYAIESATIV